MSHLTVYTLNLLNLQELEFRFTFLAKVLQNLRKRMDLSDDLNVTIYEPNALDDRLIKIFAAFCLDIQILKSNFFDIKT